MWDWFINFLTQILRWLADLSGDWGIAIVLLTFIIRLLVMPLMTRSTASSAKMQALQPKMLEIQQKYADDPERQAEEMRKFYSDNKFNPLGGCLPIFLQMPIFFALFSVARDKVPETAHFLNIMPSLAQSASGAMADGFSAAAVYVIFDIAFGVLTFIPMMMNLKNTSEEQRQQTLIMGIVMSAMMLWFGWTVPGAVLIYYDTSAIWQVIQQKVVTQRVMDRVKAETEAKLAESQSVQVDVVRREHKKRPHKKS